MSGAADIYEASIVTAARRATGRGALDGSTGEAMVDNPLCGDRVSMQVEVSDGTLKAVGHQVRGCLLCEAAATVIAEEAPGRPVAALREMAEQTAAALAEDTPFGWESLEMFRPVCGVRSRHRCVVLPFEALARALDAD